MLNQTGCGNHNCDVPRCNTNHYIYERVYEHHKYPRLNEDVDKPLESLAKRLDRIKNYLINQAIKEFIAKQSFKDPQWQDTLEALESIKTGNALEEEDVNAWLNSWGTGSRR